MVIKPGSMRERPVSCSVHCAPFEVISDRYIACWQKWGASHPEWQYQEYAHNCISPNQMFVSVFLLWKIILGLWAEL